MWWIPKTYQSTTSVFSMFLLALVHSASPVSRTDWLTNSPAGHRSSGLLGVTHRVWPITVARWKTGEFLSNIIGSAPLGSSLYDGCVPSPLTTLVLTTFHDLCVSKLTSCIPSLSVVSAM